MSNTFNLYGQYYDMLYKDKDYTKEAAYIDAHIKKWAPSTKNILELGCGTGKHAELLCKFGYNVTGLEASDAMLAIGQKRASEVNKKEDGRFDILHGDARRFKIDCVFDAVISLFHVVSYQSRNCDCCDLFRCVSNHLKPGGVFLFDVWYGPAVLKTPPENRVKRMTNNSLKITRIAEPSLNTYDNTVDVEYTILVQQNNNDRLEEIHETHKMRYFFGPEISLLANLHGFEIINSEEWLSSKPPSDETWGVLYVARKN